MEGMVHPVSDHWPLVHPVTSSDTGLENGPRSPAGL